MLIRFTLDNFFSFGEEKEFSLIPNRSLKTLQHHKYNNECDFEVLKVASIYGANGAGKSNIVKSLDLLQSFICTEKIPYPLNNSRFKFDDEKKEQTFTIEFIQDNIPFYYGIVLSENRVTAEELYVSGLGRKPDELIFERKTDNQNETTIRFVEDFEKDEKSQLLKAILLDEFVKPEKPVIKLLSKRDNQFLKLVKLAYKWFDDTLTIITPHTYPNALAHRMDKDPNFKKYAKDLICSYNTGVSDLTSEKKEIREFFGKGAEKEIEEYVKVLSENPNKIIGLRDRHRKEVILVNENGEILAKTLKIGHSGKGNKEIFFDLEEESEGTIRLLDFVPAFRDVVSNKKVYVIDEIERSIHPLLIKELIEKFSLDEKTVGQLIFTTHESNLLDQKIFRKDEIWFVEKNKEGASDLYSLNDFKEHKTIDIQKGYLSGRYGSIPFLGNLQDLNWHDNDTKE